MLARLIMAVVLAAFAVPSVAASPCHDAPVVSHAMRGHEDKAVPAHSCISCIPPADWMAARVSVPVPVTPALPAPVIARLDLGEGWPPGLPPPRIG